MKISPIKDLQELEEIMLRTITVGTCVSVQGTFEAQLDNGRIVVRVDDRLFVGRPVSK